MEAGRPDGLELCLIAGGGAHAGLRSHKGGPNPNGANSTGSGVWGGKLRRTTIASVHVRNQRGAEGIQVGDHLRVFTHLVQLGNGKIRLAQARGRGTSSGLQFKHWC